MSMNQSDILDTIVNILSGREWDADTPQRIRDLLVDNGYVISDVGDEPLITHGDYEFSPIHRLAPRARFVVEVEHGYLLCDRHGRVVGVSGTHPSLSCYVFFNVGEYHDWADNTHSADEVKRRAIIDGRLLGKWYRSANGRIEYLSYDDAMRHASRAGKD